MYLLIVIQGCEQIHLLEKIQAIEYLDEEAV